MLQLIRSIILLLHAHIISSLSSQDGGFSEGQQGQSAGRDAGILLLYLPPYSPDLQSNRGTNNNMSWLYPLMNQTRMTTDTIREKL